MASDPALPFDPTTGVWRTPEPSAARTQDAAPSPTAPTDAPLKGWLATAATVVLALDLGILTLGALEQIVLALRHLANGTHPEATAVPAGLLWANAILLLLLMGIVPLTWVIATRQRPLDYLRLHTPLPSLLRGAGIGLLMVAALIPIALVLQKLGLEEANPVVESILASITLPLAIAISLSAAIGEEILFRGILQRWVGVWGQAALFGLVDHVFRTGAYSVPDRD